jgi:hypothetical protein
MLEKGVPMLPVAFGDHVEPEAIREGDDGAYGQRRGH